MSTLSLYLMARRPREYTTTEQQFLAVLATQLRTLRQRSGLSQEELADRASLSRSHITKVEDPTTDLQLITLFRLSRALNVPLAHLIAESEKNLMD